jgi:hypothetical protein
MEQMDIVAGYWMRDTELKDTETQFKALRDGHMLEMRMRDHMRNWKEVAQDHKSYINAVRAIHA